MSENKLLGNLPTIVAEAGDIIQSFQEQMQNASQMSNSELEQSMKDIQQAMEESAAEAQEEENRLIGKKVPVEGNPYDFIKIKEAVIDKVKSKSSRLQRERQFQVCPRRWLHTGQYTCPRCNVFIAHYRGQPCLASEYELRKSRKYRNIL